MQKACARWLAWAATGCCSRSRRGARSGSVRSVLRLRHRRCRLRRERWARPLLPLLRLRQAGRRRRDWHPRGFESLVDQLAEVADVGVLGGGVCVLAIDGDRRKYACNFARGVEGGTAAVALARANPDRKGPDPLTHRGHALRRAACARFRPCRLPSRSQSRSRLHPPPLSHRDGWGRGASRARCPAPRTRCRSCRWSASRWRPPACRARAAPRLVLARRRPRSCRRLRWARAESHCYRRFHCRRRRN